MIQKVIAVRDESCHWYVIPENLYDRWIELNKLMDGENQTVFEKAEDEFIKMFSKYMTGGDLNNIQLYAELNEEV